MSHFGHNRHVLLFGKEPESDRRSHAHTRVPSALSLPVTRSARNNRAPSVSRGASVGEFPWANSSSFMTPTLGRTGARSPDTRQPERSRDPRANRPLVDRHRDHSSKSRKVFNFPKLGVDPFIEDHIIVSVTVDCLFKRHNRRYSLTLALLKYLSIVVVLLGSRLYIVRCPSTASNGNESAKNSCQLVIRRKPL
jgi:hypothetical protein